MELRHLRYFLAVADEAHFGRAAKRLHIVQPALSMQIKALEEELGGPLFIRTSRRVELTDAGRLLRTEAQRALAHANHARETVQRAMRGQIGKVRVGYVGNSIVSGILPKHLHEFHAAYPDAELQIHEMPRKAQLDALLSGELDVAYTTVHKSEHPDGLAADLIGQWPLVVAVHKNHPFAGKKQIDLKTLTTEPLIIYAAANEPGQNALHKGLPKEMRIAYVNSNALGVMGLATAGLGVALVPETFKRLAVPDLVFRPLRDSKLRADLWLYCRKGESNGAVNAYLGIAQKRTPTD